MVHHGLTLSAFTLGTLPLTPFVFLSSPAAKRRAGEENLHKPGVFRMWDVDYEAQLHGQAIGEILSPLRNVASPLVRRPAYRYLRGMPDAFHGVSRHTVAPLEGLEPPTTGLRTPSLYPPELQGRRNGWLSAHLIQVYHNRTVWARCSNSALIGIGSSALPAACHLSRADPRPHL